MSLAYCSTVSARTEVARFVAAAASRLRGRGNIHCRNCRAGMVMAAVRRVLVALASAVFFFEVGRALLLYCVKMSPTAGANRVVNARLQFTDTIGAARRCSAARRLLWETAAGKL